MLGAGALLTGAFIVAAAAILVVGAAMRTVSLGVGVAEARSRYKRGKA